MRTNLEDQLAKLTASRDATAGQLSESARELETLRGDLKQREEALREIQAGHEREKSQLAADLARAKAQREQADKAAAVQAEEHQKQLTALSSTRRRPRVNWRQPPSSLKR